MSADAKLMLKVDEALAAAAAVRERQARLGPGGSYDAAVLGLLEVLVLLAGRATATEERGVSGAEPVAAPVKRRPRKPARKAVRKKGAA